jgi:hypothetical protein
VARLARRPHLPAAREWYRLQLLRLKEEIGVTASTTAATLNTSLTRTSGVIRLPAMPTGSLFEEIALRERLPGTADPVALGQRPHWGIDNGLPHW